MKTEQGDSIQKILKKENFVGKISKSGQNVSTLYYYFENFYVTIVYIK